jgi:hypothetical protein
VGLEVKVAVPGMRRPYLVAADYGQGAVWAFVVAESEELIEREFPELKVVRDPLSADRTFDARGVAATMSDRCSML